MSCSMLNRLDLNLDLLYCILFYLEYVIMTREDKRLAKHQEVHVAVPQQSGSFMKTTSPNWTDGMGAVTCVCV